MREAMAVTGYLGADLVDKITSVSQIEIQPERDYADIVVRVNSADVAEVRTGSTVNGLTLVQLILRDGAIVETVSRFAASQQGMVAYHDPVLNRVRQEATAKAIMI